MMPRLGEILSARIRTRTVRPAQRQLIPEENRELSDVAIRAIEEGRADHAAGRTVTMAEVVRELQIKS